MRRKRLITVFLGLLLALGVTARAQDSTSDESKGAAKQGAASGASQQPASSDSAPSPDEIIEQMGGGQQPAAEGRVEDTTTSPALLEEGNFEAGRDIFKGIFDTTPEAGPALDGLPGMRVEEVSLTGIMTGAFGTVALFLGKDKNVYAARENQKFANGRLAEIRGDKVVFEQEVIDEFGKQRPPIVKEVPLHTTPTKKGRG
jgi:hypothetical protein